MAKFDISNLNQDPEVYKQGLENLSGVDASASGLNGDIASLINGSFKALQGFSMASDGLSLISDGASYTAGVYRSAGKASKQGSDFKASVYRQSGSAAIVAANYNIALDELQTNRQQDALGRQLKDVLSSNNAVFSSTGLGIGSKSAMLVNNTVLSTVERQAVQTKNDAMQRQSLIRYQGQLTQTQYENMARAEEYSGQVAVQSAENQARSAEYSGKVESYKVKTQQADQIGGAVGDIFKSFGGL